MQRLDEPRKRIVFGETMDIRVAVNLNGLRPEDVRVELLVGRNSKRGHEEDFNAIALAPEAHSGGECVFTLALAPELCGRLLYRIRIYPHHDLLTHPFETGLMLWL